MQAFRNGAPMSDSPSDSPSDSLTDRLTVGSTGSGSAGGGAGGGTGGGALPEPAREIAAGYAVSGAALDAAVKDSSLYGRYAQAVDRESAYEKLSAGQEAQRRAAEAEAAEIADRAAVEEAVRGERARGAEKAAEEDASLVEQAVASGMFRSLARSVGTQLGREISRSLFGTARRRR